MEVAVCVSRKTDGYRPKVRCKAEASHSNVYFSKSVSNGITANQNRKGSIAAHATTFIRYPFT